MDLCCLGSILVGTHKGTFYLDPYTRYGEKYGGSWVDAGRLRSSQYPSAVPLSFINLNITPSLGSVPALLEFSQVFELFTMVSAWHISISTLPDPDVLPSLVYGWIIAVTDIIKNYATKFGGNTFLVHTKIFTRKPRLKEYNSYGLTLRGLVVIPKDGVRVGCLIHSNLSLTHSSSAVFFAELLVLGHGFSWWDGC